MKKDDVLMHYGTPQHFVNDPNGSGRYRKGTGEHAYQRDTSFLGQYEYFKRSGKFKNDTEIARAMGYSSGEFRDMKKNAKEAKRLSDRAKAIELLNKQKESYNGRTNYSEIARELYGDSKKESTVRLLLNDVMAERTKVTSNVADLLKRSVDEKKYIDVGAGVETRLGISDTQLRAAITKLKDQGYHIEKVYVEQVGTGKQTTINTLVGPDCDWKEVNRNKDQIKLIDDYSIDNSRTILNIEPPVSVSSDRIKIAYESPKDGVIELRRGVDDISLGNARYAQVRIAVDDTHYLKGMAVYSDDMPKGVDIIYNTNKHPGTPMMAPDKNDSQVLKPLKLGKDNVFGATIKNEEDLQVCQKYYIDKNGEKKLSPVNIVSEQGDWDKWSKSLSSQMLSKQSPVMAKKQLEITSTTQRSELDTIKSLTNPIVKKKLLDSFADDCDSKAVHLKAANLPRQASHVLLPITTLKENEIYAPRYNNGETVVLIRYPHGGKFEIPTLKVNNNNRTAKSIIGPDAPDAVGINPKVAGRLSGADFDGDTALVIPVNSRVKVQTVMSPAYKELQTFDPKESFPGYPGMKVMSNQQKQREMGVVSNLITDMTIGGAKDYEIARAVKHSMVVIDAEKHKLNWKLSEQENGIAELKAKYQTGGASTIVSRAKSEARVPERKEITNTSRMTPQQLADWNAGKKVYVETGKTYKDRNGNDKPRMMKSTKMAEAGDAYTLTSGGSKKNPGTVVEGVYAEHANTLKRLGEEARKESRNIKGGSVNYEAKKIYAPEVDSLNAKLDRAMKNKPLERQAQLIANKKIAMEIKANPDMDKDEKKRLKQQALSGARYRVGKEPYVIDITPKEWEAIQSGAISKTKLEKILDSADMDQVKQYATPRNNKGLTPAKIAKAKALLAGGHTQAEVAEELGVSVSTLSRNLH